MRRLLSLLCASLLSIVVAVAQQANGYYYRTWTTTANVSSDNTWTIVEKYDVHYDSPYHGVYRYIQNEYGANRDVSKPEDPYTDVQYRVYRPKIQVRHTEGDEVMINESDDNDNTVIRWGNADRTVIGDHTYLLNYSYQHPDDRVEGRDYIFQTLVPNDKYTIIQRFDFSIHFEKPLPADIADRLKIYCGGFGAETLAKVENLQVTPTDFSGTIYDIGEYAAVTLFAELPADYYEGTIQPKTWPGKVCYYLALALALLLIYYCLTEKGPEYVKSVEFYAPKGVTPILVGKIIDGSTDDIDIAAMIPWLAKEGYIEVHDIPKESGLFGKKADVMLRKVMDLPDAAPSYQHKIMSLLFCKGDELYMSKIGDRHAKVAAAKDAVDKLFKGDMKLSNTHHGLLAIGLCLVSTLAVLYASPVALWYADQIVGAGIWGVGILGAWITRVSAGEAQLFTAGWKKILIQIGRFLVFAFMAMMIYVITLDQGESIFTSTEILVFIAVCFVAIELSIRTVHNTPYRTEMAGKLKGFQEFIATADKDRLNMLVDQNPEYFYDVLPYAMIFGLTDKWSNLFKDIEIQQASWYHSTQAFNSYNFCNSMTSFSNQVSNAIKTSAVDHTKSSSHGGGGGGFSGGGGGGGGAGAW